MRRITDLALPGQPHVPGSGSCPDMPPLEAAKALAPPITRSDDWQANAAYLYGHDLLEAGFYWEAHEVWEEVWLNCPANSAEKVLLQLLIQRANAGLKRRMGRDKAARRLDSEVQTLARELHGRLDGTRKPLMGVDISQLIAL